MGWWLGIGVVLLGVVAVTAVPLAARWQRREAHHATKLFQKQRAELQVTFMEIVIRIHLPELAALHAPFQDGLHQKMSAADDFIVVELADFGKIAALGKHQFRNAAEFRRSDGPPPVENNCAQQLGRRAVMFLQQALATLDERHDAGTDDRLEQFFLAGEIQIQGAFADARAGGDLVEPGCGKTAFDEQIERSGHQFGGTRLLAPGPAAILFGLEIHDLESAATVND